MASTQNSDSGLEEQRVAACDQPYIFPSHTDSHKSICGRVGWEAGEQSGTGEGERVLERDRLVDDCCCAGYIHEFDAVIPPVQVGAAVSNSTHDLSTSEISDQYDVLQSQCAG